MGGEPGNEKKHFQVGYGLTLLSHQDQTTALTHLQQRLREPPGDGIGLVRSDVTVQLGRRAQLIDV